MAGAGWEEAVGRAGAAAGVEEEEVREEVEEDEEVGGESCLD